MPLAHLRSFFCSQINTAAIDFIAQHNYSSMKSIYIIDGIVNMNQPNVYEVVTDEDPFVMLAWKCPNLKKFVLIGEYSKIFQNIPNIMQFHVIQE